MLSIDKITGSGEVAFDGGGRKPVVTAKLRLGQLDLNPYLPPEAETKGQAGGKPAAIESGALDLDVPSIRKLANWVGAPLQAVGY